MKWIKWTGIFSSSSSSLCWAAFVRWLLLLDVGLSREHTHAHMWASGRANTTAVQCSRWMLWMHTIRSGASFEWCVYVLSEKWRTAIACVRPKPWELCTKWTQFIFVYTHRTDISQNWSGREVNSVERGEFRFILTFGFRAGFFFVYSVRWPRTIFYDTMRPDRPTGQNDNELINKKKCILVLNFRFIYFFFSLLIDRL